MHATPSDLDRLLPLGRTLFALRQALRGSGDARLALQYLFFHSDVNDPQVTPLLSQHGVNEAIAPALEDFVCAQLRPWMRQIDLGAERVASWADRALKDLTLMIGSDPRIEPWAAQILKDAREAAGPAALERWRVALEDGRCPDAGADRLLGAIGLLQECCGVTVSTASATPWEIRKGE